MIISGFAGIGKSTLGKENPKVLDLESSDYKFIFTEEQKKMPAEERKGIVGREKDPTWPNNYISAIIAADKKYDLVLIAMNIEIRTGLLEAGATFALAYPGLDCREEIIQRTKDRGNNEFFTNLIAEKYTEWINDLEAQPQRKIRLAHGEYLKDALVREGIL